jgi:hypothetical protein
MTSLAQLGDTLDDLPLLMTTDDLPDGPMIAFDGHSDCG